LYPGSFPLTAMLGTRLQSIAVLW